MSRLHAGSAQAPGHRPLPRVHRPAGHTLRHARLAARQPQLGPLCSSPGAPSPGCASSLKEEKKRYSFTILFHQGMGAREVMHPCSVSQVGKLRPRERKEGTQTLEVRSDKARNWTQIFIFSALMEFHLGTLSPDPASSLFWVLCCPQTPLLENLLTHPETLGNWVSWEQDYLIFTTLLGHDGAGREMVVPAS